MYRFPYSISNLSGSGARPLNGRPLHAAHFNRLFQEVTAIESAIGPNPQGNLSDLKTRLAVCLNDDGTYKKELLCEDDPSGNGRGSLRYLQYWAQDIEFSGTTGQGLVRLHYTAFDEPPVIILCATEVAFSSNMERMQLIATTQFSAAVDARTINSSGVAGGSNPIICIAVSKSLKVWQEDEAWALPPVRTGT